MKRLNSPNTDRSKNNKSNAENRRTLREFDGIQLINNSVNNIDTREEPEFKIEEIPKTEVNPLLKAFQDLNLKTLESKEKLSTAQKIFLFCNINVYKNLKSLKHKLHSRGSFSNHPVDSKFEKDTISKKTFYTNGNNKQTTFHHQNGIKIEIFDEIFNNILKYVNRFYYEDFKVKNREIMQEILFFIWKSKNHFDFENLININLPSRNQSEAGEALRRNQTINTRKEDSNLNDLL